MFKCPYQLFLWTYIWMTYLTHNALQMSDGCNKYTRKMALFNQPGVPGIIIPYISNHSGWEWRLQLQFLQPRPPTPPPPTHTQRHILLEIGTPLQIPNSCRFLPSFTLKTEEQNCVQSTLGILKSKFIPNYWYLKVHFLVPENLLWDISNLR